MHDYECGWLIMLSFGPNGIVGMWGVKTECGTFKDGYVCQRRCSSNCLLKWCRTCNKFLSPLVFLKDIYFSCIFPHCLFCFYKCPSDCSIVSFLKELIFILTFANHLFVYFSIHTIWLLDCWFSKIWSFVWWSAL